MYNNNITIQAVSDYNADMWELTAPTDGEMQAMYEDAQARGLAV